ncbi:MAG: hypothetical protein HZB91_03415 [Elusimicrobia bacterium]|nr:hypothetical protein [Elusimicrobiota bacterium]MBI5882136.1 hypothetical protein [Elusimicrobiota bacterium]
MRLLILAVAAAAAAARAAASPCALLPGETIQRTIRGRSFEVRRLDDDSAGRQRYRLRIPVRFVRHRELPAPRDFKEKMASLAARCYAEAAPAMLGPEGERIELELVQAGRGAAEIEVFGGYAWVPFTQWSVDYNCPTLVHETMHLLGLPDVYPLTERPYEVDDDGRWVRWIKEDEADALPPGRRKRLPRYCRPPGPEDSLLHDQYEAYRAAGLSLGKADFLWVHRHECPRRSKDDAEPGKYLHCVEMKAAMPPGRREDGPGESALAAFNALGLGREAARAKPSLFYPNEARALLRGPACDEKVRKFEACAANSDRKEEEGCLPVPEDCAQGRAGWLTE